MLCRSTPEWADGSIAGANPVSLDSPEFSRVRAENDRFCLHP